MFGSPWTTWGTTAATGEPSAYGLDIAALAIGAYRVGLAALDGDGVEISLGDIGLTIEPATADEDDPAAQPFALAAPTPNPASGVAIATLTLDRLAHVLAVVYDALGREALVAFDQIAVGRVPIEVDTTRLAPGVYVLRAVAVDGSATASRTFSVAR
ncbi:MAG TPA: T9SS type A sorting domain-containing protein [Rhodothermales bacterium]|nr:T9SS type A sorting domain-containing protein [Rhodothermales bacterium]